MWWMISQRAGKKKRKNGNEEICAPLARSSNVLRDDSIFILFFSTFSFIHAGFVIDKIYVSWAIQCLPKPKLLNVMIPKSFAIYPKAFFKKVSWCNHNLDVKNNPIREIFKDQNNHSVMDKFKGCLWNLLWEIFEVIISKVVNLKSIK